MIECNCDYCIYQHNNTCTLQKIRLKEDGSCDDCIHYSIDDYARDRLKEITLQKIENRYI